MSLPDGYVQEEWVYTGLGVDDKGKRLYGWSNIENVEKTLWFGKNLVTASVGNTYLITVKHLENDGLTVKTSGDYYPSWIRQYDNKEKVTEWAILDESTRQLFAKKSMNTKASKEVPLSELYDEIKKASKNLNRTERLAFIAKLSEVVLESR